MYAQARAAIPVDPNAMVVATVGPDGQPSARVVLLKEFDARGFVFYTNYESRKGEELLAHPKAALVLHWAPLERQVRIEGGVEPVSPEEADAYFQSRPRGSQVGAWASAQSRPLKSREELEQRVEALTRQYEGKPIPRPPHWSGFRVVPRRIEFWHARASRLHERLVYARDGVGSPWHTEMLNP
nr:MULTISPECIES: pyridoxamine 5'-phosphate oxidase [Myxococcaceae]